MLKCVVQYFGNDATFLAPQQTLTDSSHMNNWRASEASETLSGEGSVTAEISYSVHEIREKSEIKREEIRNQKDWKSNQTLLS